MSKLELKDILELMVSMLRKHEDRLDAISKQLIAMQKSSETNSEPLYDKLDITGEDAPHGMKSVLVVDDDPNIVKTYKLVLESVGYSVDTARNGIEALFKSKKVHHDLIIIDMNLPDMLGNELADQIKEEKPNIKIIMITGYSSYMEELDEFNIDKMLMKPIPPEDLVEIAKKALATEESY